MPKRKVRQKILKVASPPLPTNMLPSLAQRLADLHDDFFQTNQKRYLILGQALCLSREIEEDLSMRRELDAACALADLRFKEDTPELNRVLRYMVDGDHGRGNNYAAALREIPSDHITPDQIAAFITEAGGIEKLRRSGSKANKARSVPQPTKNIQVQPHQGDDGAHDKLVRSVDGHAGAHTVQHQAGADTNKHPVSAAESVGSTGRDQSDEKNRPGQQVEPGAHTLVPHDEAHGQAQGAPQGGVAGQDFKTIARSAVNADTLPRQAFFMMGGQDAKKLMGASKNSRLSQFVRV
jgi:hypothetical protein